MIQKLVFVLTPHHMLFVYPIHGNVHNFVSSFSVCDCVSIKVLCLYIICKLVCNTYSCVYYCIHYEYYLQNLSEIVSPQEYDSNSELYLEASNSELYSEVLHTK